MYSRARQLAWKRFSKAERVGGETEPQEVGLWMPRKLAPEGAEPQGALGDGYLHHLLDGHAVAHAVHEAADAAYALGDEHVVLVLALFDEELEPGGGCNRSAAPASTIVSSFKMRSK